MNTGLLLQHRHPPGTLPTTPRHHNTQHLPPTEGSPHFIATRSYRARLLRLSLKGHQTSPRSATTVHRRLPVPVHPSLGGTTTFLPPHLSQHSLTTHQIPTHRDQHLGRPRLLLTAVRQTPPRGGSTIHHRTPQRDPYRPQTRQRHFHWPRPSLNPSSLHLARMTNTHLRSHARSTRTMMGRRRPATYVRYM